MTLADFFKLIKTTDALPFERLRTTLVPSHVGPASGDGAGRDDVSAKR